MAENVKDALGDPGETCGDCKYFVADTPSPPPPPGGRPPPEPEGDGECHRYPPVIADSKTVSRPGAKSHWPRTTEGNFCGEFTEPDEEEPSSPPPPP